MKRFLAILIAGVALMAAVLIPLDARRSNHIEIYDPAEQSTAIPAEENSTEAAVSEEPGETEGQAVPEASGEAEPPHSAEAEAPSETAQEPHGAQQKQAAGKTPAATSARPAPTSPQATKPAATKPAAPGIQLPTRPAQQPTQQATRPTPTKPASPDSGSGNQSYAERVVELVNQERAKEGLAPLTVNKSAEAAALVRARETEKSFSHTRPNGSSFSTALTEQGVSYRSAGENIAWGQKTPEQVMQGWMNSSGHRANIMNPRFTSIGVGYYRSASGTNYWTQLFIG